jgi:hypothetical protein
VTEPARPVVWISHRGGETCARCARRVETGSFIVIEAAGNARRPEERTRPRRSPGHELDEPAGPPLGHRRR